MRIRAALPACLALTFVSALAHAETESQNPNGPTTKATRRSDFAMGATVGFGFGRASGYPNEIDKIGDADYRSSTKLGVGSGGLVWLGVAFNDYLTFGIGVGSVGLSGNDRNAKSTVFGFHVDAFPLFDVNPKLRDLSVFANVGTGPLKITGGPDEADGGLLSYLEGGVAYEPLRLWRFAMGPSLSVMHLWSDSAKLTGGLVGARVVFYGGP
jgi:hypothetical protein